MKTEDRQYTERLSRLQSVGWKKLLNVQLPYRYNLQRLELGFVLDVGCGLGRNLINLNGQGVGVDHNRHSVEFCRQAGLTAYGIDEFMRSDYAREGRFDTLLIAHVLEHIEESLALELLTTYRPYIKPGGKVVMITPQRAGFKSDSTHVRYVGFEEIASLCSALKLSIVRQYSFPFPAFVGNYFRYNEHVVVAINC